MLELSAPAATGRHLRAPRRRPCGPVASRALAAACVALVLMAIAFAASANNAGENAAWHFQTSADRVNQAAVQDMIQKRRSGYYAAPVYTTNIDRQYNCNVTASAQGNDGTNSTIANSPSTTGASAAATGNDNTTQVRGSDGSLADATQWNTGAVGSSVRGSTNASLQGWSRQALNSNQSNTGAQSAQVSGSSACAFGAIN